MGTNMVTDMDTYISYTQSGYVTSTSSRDIIEAHLINYEIWNG